MFLAKISTAIKAISKSEWQLFSSEGYQILRCALEYGPYLRHRNQVSSNDSNALDFRSKVEKIISAPQMKAKCQSLSIAVEIIENREFNAFASKLSLNRESYLIALFSGAVRELQKLTSSSSFIGVVRQSIPQFKKITDEELSLTALYFCSSFIAYHEVGHVVRGHLNLRLSSGGKPVWLEGDTGPLTFNNGVLTSHVTECDADNFAGRLLLGAAAECAKLAIGTGRVASNSKTIQGFRELACACAGLIFFLFDTQPHNAGDYYPIAPIRLAIALGMFADQLVIEGEKQKIALDTALRGLLISQAVAKANNWQQQKIDLATEFSDWQQQFLPEVRSAASVLHIYAPCSKQ